MWGASTRAQKGGPGTVNSDRCLLGALLRVVVAVKPSVDETGWKVVVERRLHWQLMALVVGVDESGEHHWMWVVVAGLGKVADHGDRGGFRVVMDVKINAVNGDGDKGVEVMGLSVEGTALAMWVGEQGRRRERRWTLLVVVVAVGRECDDAHH